MRTIRRHRGLTAAALLAVPLVVAATACNTRFGANLQRPDDPVVVSGALLPKLSGVAPSSVVGFAWDGEVWTQVPVQVDERDLVNPGQVYHLPASAWPKLYNTSTPYKMLVYTPPATLSRGYTSMNTYTPPDSDPGLDANDEVSFMGGDTGVAADASVAPPAGVDGASRQEVVVTDPLAPEESGRLYLFHSTTANLTGGSAGTTLVTYSFQLTSGEYKDTYKMGTSSLAPNNAWGFNPETSTVSTPAYSIGFSDRWLNDSMSIQQSGANRADLLDRTMYYVTALCVRTEDTFDGADTGEGAFIVNISGPVRAIRSAMGANSYKYTVKTDVFYPRRQQSTIQLIGHSGLPGYGSSNDLTTGLVGMTYSDAVNSGLTIDGVPDAFTPTTFTTGSGSAVPDSWQMVSGAAGSLVTVSALTTDISGLKVASVYTDNSGVKRCTGDASSWGRNGIDVTNMPGTVVTDPTLTSTPSTFTTYRTRVFAGPNLPADRAAQVADEVTNPPQVSVTP